LQGVLADPNLAISLILFDASVLWPIRVKFRNMHGGTVGGWLEHRFVIACRVRLRATQPTYLTPQRLRHPDRPVVSIFCG